MIPENFAADWQAAWNSHDLDRIMAHYAADIVFRSQKAVPLIGHGELHGHIALRAYWAQALSNQPDLKFTVTGVFNGFEMIVLSYTNQEGRNAVETLRFNAEGLVVEASACHKPEVSP